MKSRCIGKWTITKPTNDGSGGYTTYETSDVAEIREAGRRGWGISQHIEVDFGDDPTIDDRSLEESAVVGYLSETKATKPDTVTDEMVSRFLAWKLPKDFSPDCYIAFDREKASQGSWPVGTNLLHAEQARAMLEHVIASPAIDAAPEKSQADLPCPTCGGEIAKRFNSLKDDNSQAVALSDQQKRSLHNAVKALIACHMLADAVVLDEMIEAHAALPAPASKEPK